MSESQHQAGQQEQHKRHANQRLLTKLSIVAVAMFGFGFALVPFYEQICEVTGIRDLLRPSEEPVNTQVDPTRTVTIELDANTRDLPWTFQAKERSIDIHPGQFTTVVYRVHNKLDRPVTGQAIPSWGPEFAGQYFKKLECFCFKQQTLAAGETRDMPVVFVLDADLPKEVRTITMSYTFFEVPGAVKQPG